MTMSEPLMASAAEAPSRTPNSSPALRSRAPAGCGNRMSQAAMVVTPAPRSPEAKAWPASPKPMKQRRGVLRDMRVPRTRACDRLDFGSAYEIRDPAASKRGLRNHPCSIRRAQPVADPSLRQDVARPFRVILDLLAEL